MCLMMWGSVVVTEPIAKFVGKPKRGLQHLDIDPRLAKVAENRCKEMVKHWLSVGSVTGELDLKYLVRSCYLAGVADGALLDDAGEK